MSFLWHMVYEQYFLSVPLTTASFAHKTVIITGANSGLGKEAARHIARLGCPRLILGVRNFDAGEEARRDILATTGAADASIQVWKVDLSQFTSVRAFATRATQELDRLDILICNAGINTFKYAELEGFESMLTVNVLSTYLIATLLLPLLESTAAMGPVSGDPEPRPPHLTFVGSDTHLTASKQELGERPADLLESISTNCKRSGSRLRQEYAYSKLLILLLARNLAYRQLSSSNSNGSNDFALADRHAKVVVNVVNPGLCYSNLVNEVAGLAKIIMFVMRARPAEAGGGAIVNAACAGWSTHGQFLSSNKVHKGSNLSWARDLGENLHAATKEALGDMDMSVNN